MHFGTYYSAHTIIYIRIPFYKRLVSYLYPVSLRRAAGAVNTDLQIYLYRNQLQLATPDAFYSDGDRYRPAVAAANYLKPSLHGVKSVLALGLGLGSIVRVLRRKGCQPHFTLVEYDKVVLQWAMEFLEEETPALVNPVCVDAQVFMLRNTMRYDLIFVDIFVGRVVPAFVSSPAFLKQCRESLNPGGRLVFNYIINDNGEWDVVKETFSSIFPTHHMISLNINRIFIASLP